MLEQFLRSCRSVSRGSRVSGPLLAPIALVCALGCASDDAGTATKTDGRGSATKAGGNVNVDLVGVNYKCQNPNWKPGVCGPGVVTSPPQGKPDHIDLPIAISYTDKPPSSGPHRPGWAKWGQYAFLPPQRWVHNLEHGAIALLYHPCAPQALVDTLKKWAESVPADGGGAFRWILTPYPELPSELGLVAWGHVYLSNCWTPTEAEDFRKAYYNKASEDVPMNGDYSELWLGL